ncbi:MAG: hypothetical protein EAZ90_22050 [Oscillatoriales cyanobacterium]|uniref:hypothetical protein n=1 Tax=Microcoleus sp. PH2017_16_JOR_D_A TaxID=2798827 RepID=UPI001D640731|nr:hypothetical protein [Microcoleus sp. PH2017_16_JOR_D_A]MCC3549553.1 hypothetical protein [Microcoleus sp. PH2017_24_DOB_U_A]TAE08259.1 MAG: hypothetical protein EAZ94_25865 [Oscillatoriales cyanobacterium]TAE18960.1 MAG: hypothetical protein EAZ93_28195 [Oscillatoriales cyanobacterium]TAE39785.1 MAG: hypothetical protein EAZ90_22050 [Oscillatoriales cyanobacterium]
MVESPPAGAGEIKIRLFITPILGLKGRGYSQTVTGQLRGQARTIHCPYQRSTVNCQLSTVNCQLLKFWAVDFTQKKARVSGELLWLGEGNLDRHQECFCYLSRSIAPQL